MRRCLLALAMLALAVTVSANNITVSHIFLTGANTTAHYTMVKFDLSWDNSWRVTDGPANWDAAWVFVKYRVQGQTVWHHATLHYVDGSGPGDGHIVPSGAVIGSSNDNGSGGAYGVFVYHNAPMSQGTVNYAGTELRWDYGVNGVGDADKVDVEVFAIEMVYVPQGSFYLGTGGTEGGAFYTYPTSTQPYQVTSENAIPVGMVNGNLSYGSTANGEDNAGPIPAVFPKGYKAFYCMKYETTGDQYIAFLNTLDANQASTRVSNSQIPTSPYITGSSPGLYVSIYPTVAIPTLSWEDLAAYLDWAALRPMTELEFEKACRGPELPVAGEFAWGTNTLQNYDPVTKAVTTGNFYTLSNANTATEGIATGYSVSAGNAIWKWTYTTRPTRPGIFAANGNNTGRVSSGGSYYGIMELSGNAWEQAVSVGVAAGRTYTGTHGDGIIDAGGISDAGWPTVFTGGVGVRGGFYLSLPGDLMVSDRSSASAASFPFNGAGGRGVRTAP